MMCSTSWPPSARAVNAMNSLSRIALALVLLAPAIAAAQPTGERPASDPDIRSRYDLATVQGILAVQRLDGWLLYDLGGQNPVAVELVNPEGKTTRRWFYLIPAEGQPRLLVHASEKSRFDRVPGTKLDYTSHRDLEAGLLELLEGTKSVAMEYAPKATVPQLSRVDAATVKLVESNGVSIRSSAELVQFTKSLWGPKGRVAHYVAAHHLEKLKDEALAWLGEQVSSGRAVTEHDLQKRILDGYDVRGLSGPPPIVAAGKNTAVPNYTPSGRRSALIKKGDLVLIDMSARVIDAERPIYATLTWMAYVGDTVPRDLAGYFSVVAGARDAALDLVRERLQRRRAVRGFEVDQTARAKVGEAGHADRFVHRTGHSLDTDVHGDGANLDDYETHDTRNLVLDSGYAVEPGIYLPGQLGVRTEVDIYVGRYGLEITTPVQQRITPILAR